MSVLIIYIYQWLLIEMSKFFNIHYKSSMDAHCNQQSFSILKKLRSNSIKNPPHFANIGPMVKLNAKKFPADFFSRNQTSACKPRILNSERAIGSKTEQRRSQRRFCQINSNQLLPEAQVTSFFKVNHHSTETETSENVHTKSRAQNQGKMELSQLDCMISKQISTSIQLKQPYQRSMDLCCTFSKIPNSSTKLMTPQKKGATVQLKKVDDKNKQQQQYLFSARIGRPSTKKQARGNSVVQKRKSSIQRLSYNKEESNQNSQIVNKKLRKRDLVQMLFLPPIARRQ